MLDTHIWLWWLDGDKKSLRSPLRRQIQRACDDNDVAVSLISVWEIATKTAIGKLRLKFDTALWLEHAYAEWPQIRVEPVTASDMIESTRLPGELHRDPADRLIIALTRRLGATLVTVDRALLAYPHVSSLGA